MRFKAICLIICSVLGYVSPAFGLAVCGTPEQGGFLKFSDDGLTKIIVEGREYRADKEGTLAMAFGRDANLLQSLKVFYSDGSMQTKELRLNQVKWDVQKIDGVQPSKVAPSSKDEQEIIKEQKAVAKGLANFSDLLFWKGKMIEPLKGRISGNFGGQRIMNGVKKRPHQGVDIAALEGTEVKAIASGVVTLSDGPFFYCGNMIILDHGQNLSSIYAHLKELKVKEGDRVEQGQVIGTVGKTGRATGPHLHLGVSLNGVRFDALRLLSFDENKCMNL